MIFACQKNCYLQSLETKIVSCTASDENEGTFVIILEDTVLFPEGGGQPEDHGTINGIKVSSVKQNGSEALHYVHEPIPAGISCTVVVDWQRRFDHMQQHTGQHLITALAESMFNYCTTSWNLGQQISYIELDVPSVTADNILKLEQVVNDKIRNCIPISIDLYDKDDPNITEARTRLKLPDDHSGLVRVVNIGDIDSNTCCGTHVKNTSELQMIKLLYVEKGKKNKTNLFFVAGNRVVKYMDRCVLSQRSLSSLLSCGTEEMVDMVQKLQKSLKLSKKNTLLSSRELAIMEAKVFKLSGINTSFFALHKKNVEAEFMSIFLNEVNNNDTVFFLTVDEGKGGGQLTLTGPVDIVQALGPQICDLLDGKGSGKNGKYQAKFKKLANISKAEDLIRSSIESNFQK